MSIRYILGPSGSGKSQLILGEIRERLLSDDGDHPLILLVPEQSTFKAEHALVTSPGIGGFMRAQVLSFRRLAFRVMQEAGGTARVHIADNGKKMLLHKLLRERKNELRVFQHSAEHTGFIDRLNTMLVELKRYRIDPARLEHELKLGDEKAWSKQLLDKLHDLSCIYSAYEKEAAGLYVDAEDDLALLAERYEETSYAGEADIWIDDFNGFTPQEYEVLTSLMKHARSVTIALCLDRQVEADEQPEEMELFHPTAATLSRIRRIAAELGLRDETILLNGEPPIRYRESPMLAMLEQALRKDKKQQNTTFLQEDIRLVAAVHRRAEAEAAARSMLLLAREQGARWRDMAVLVRNMADYRDVLATALDDYGIPHFFDQKKSVGSHPLLELIRAALETVNGGWRYDSVFRAVKSGLLMDDTTVARMDLDQLENYVLAFGIHGSRWTDDKPWTYTLQLSLEDELPEQSERHQQQLERINETRSCIARPLSRLEQALEAAESVQDMAAALYTWLEEIGAAKQLERWSLEYRERGEVSRAKEHAGIWDSVVDVLDQCVEMMGSEKLSLPAFAELLDTGLEHIKLGLVPPALDQVLIGSMERTRPGDVKHVFVLGASDGVLPSAMPEDGLLTEKERDVLAGEGVVLAPGSLRKLLDEQYMIYAALTLPSHSLWISYPLSDDEGKAMLPSEVIRRIERLFPQLKVIVEAGEPPAHLEDERLNELLIHPGSAMSALTLQLKRAQKGLPIAESWWHLYNWLVSQPDYREKLRMRVQSLFYRNQEQQLSADTSRLLYGSPLTVSVSRMERYAACHFAHYASYGLRLKERRLYKLEAPDIGQLFHAALSMIGIQLEQEGKAWGALTEQECVQRASAAVDVLAPRLQSEILLSSYRHRYIARKLKQIVGKAASVLAVHGRRGAFTPIGLEIGFGRGAELPPLRFSLRDGTVLEVAGRIDRIDRADGDKGPLLRVIDYKSSATRLNLTEVYYGLSLQMLTYLDVAISHSKAWLGAEAKPGGMLYFHVHEPVIRVETPLTPEDAEQEQMRRFRMKGLVLADEEAVRLMDTSLTTGHSELIPVAMKADGSFYKYSSVMSEKQWHALRRHGRTMIRSIGEGIAAGKVDIAPIRVGGQTPCTFCDYKSVCQFDPQVDGNDYVYRTNYQQEEVWRYLENHGGDEL